VLLLSGARAVTVTATTGGGRTSSIVASGTFGSGTCSYTFSWNDTAIHSFQFLWVDEASGVYEFVPGASGGQSISGTSAGSLTGSFSAVAPSHSPAYTQLKILVNTQNDGGSGFTSAFGYLSGTSAARTITLTVTNPRSTPQWYGWAVVGSDRIYQPTQVDSGATQNFYVSSPVGDTQTYEVRLLNMEGEFADGTITGNYKPGDVEGVDDPYSFDMPGNSSPVSGTQKGYSDGVDGTTGATPTSPGGASGTVSPSKVTGQTPPASVTPGSPSGSPTQQSQADGTNALLKSLGELNNSVKKAGSGGFVGGGTDMSGVESRLDTANEHLTKMEGYAKNGDDFLTDAKKMDGHDEGTLTGKASSLGFSAKSKFDTDVASTKDLLPDGSHPSVPAGSGSFPSFEVPMLGTFNTDPRTVLPWLTPFMNAAREVILWLLVAGFIKFSLIKINEYALQVATTPNVNTTLAVQDMIPAAGQALSWLKGSISSAGIVAAVVVVYGAGIGLLNSHLAAAGFSAMKATMTGSAASSAMGVASASPIWSYLLESFPLLACLSLIAGEIALLAAMGPAFLAASAAVRAIRV